MEFLRNPFGFESRKVPPLTRRQFTIRLVGHGLLVAGVIVLALGIGVLGYRFFCGLSWIDSLLNASMILGGMGPVDPIVSSGGKVFASMYALFSGVIFIGVTGLMLAPFAHRLLHRFHWDEDSDSDS